MDEYANVPEPMFSMSSAVWVEWTVGGESLGGYLKIRTSEDKKQFFHLYKTDYQLRNVLLSQMPDMDNDEKKRALPRTNIIESIHTARDAGFARELEALGARSSKNTRYTSKALAGKVLQVPEYTRIDVEGTGDIPSISMNVLCTKPGTALYIELSSENLEFVSKMVKAQYDSGDIHRKHARQLVPEPELVDVDEEKVIYSYSGKRFLVTYEPTEGEKQKTKVFPTKQTALMEAMQKAKEFAGQHRRE